MYLHAVSAARESGESETLTKKKKNGQTVISDDLSALAPPSLELLNLWRDFKKVVQFIDDNIHWLRPLMSVCEKSNK